MTLKILMTVSPAKQTEKLSPSVTLGSQVNFIAEENFNTLGCFASKAWFPFGLFVPFIARLAFSCPLWVLQLRCPLLLFVALRSFLLLFITFRCPPLLFLACHCSWYQPPSIGPEFMRMNGNGNEKCSLLLFCCSFWFLVRVSICLSLPFAAFRCPFLFLR